MHSIGAPPGIRRLSSIIEKPDKNTFQALAENDDDDGAEAGGDRDGVEDEDDDCDDASKPGNNDEDVMRDDQMVNVAVEVRAGTKVELDEVEVRVGTHEGRHQGNGSLRLGVGPQGGWLTNPKSNLASTIHSDSASGGLDRRIVQPAPEGAEVEPAHCEATGKIHPRTEAEPSTNYFLDLRKIQN